MSGAGAEGRGGLRHPLRAGRGLVRLWRREGPAGVYRRLRAGPGSAPPGTGPSRVPLERQYRLWRSRVEPGAPALRRLAGEARSWEAPVPLVFLVRCGTGGAERVGATLRSLREQPYPFWRAVVGTAPGMAAEGRDDPRVSWVALDPGGDPWAALLGAAAARPDDFVAVLQPGVRVTRHGPLEVARALRADPGCDLLYTDWDEIDGGGRRRRPRFAYGWSPELLLGCDHLGGLVVQRAELLAATGGWRAGDAPVEIYAQQLRGADRARHPTHLPVVGLSRAADGAPGAETDARRRCVEAWLRGRGTSSRVATGRQPGVTDVRFELTGTPEVDIVIPTRDRADLLRRCLESLEATTYPGRRILIVDNDSRDPATLDYLAGQPHRVIRHPGAFNYSAIVNRAAQAGDAPYLLLLNNDTVVRSPDWLEAMLGWCQQPGIGAVGARLLFADGRVQHEGVGVGIGRVAANLDLGWSATRACSAVTGACMLIRRAAFEAVDGFDEGLPVVFNDVDFCLRLWRAGWRVVMTPLAELRHDEGGSRGSLAPEEDYRRFALRWGEESRLRDAFLGPHVAWPRPLTLRIPARGDPRRPR